MVRNIPLFVLLYILVLSSSGQTIIPLYDGKIPNSIPGPDMEKTDTAQNGSIRSSSVYKPTVRAYIPAKEKSTGVAVIICPGGGYSNLSISLEGYDVAIELNKLGIAAFVLKYRLPSDKIMVNKEIGPLQDAQQAIKMVRQRAKEWNIDTNKVGIMGFSAGGAFGFHSRHTF